MQVAIDGWLEQHGAAVRSQRDHLLAIYAKAKSVPSPVADTKVDAADLLFHNTSPFKDKQVAGANAEILALEKARDPDALPAEGELRVPASTEFLRVLELAAQERNSLLNQSLDPIEQQVESKLKWLDRESSKLLGLKYVVLLRQTEYVPPEFAGKSFLSGLYRADALVFRVADETLVGTVSVGVRNKAQVMTKFSLKNGSDAKDALKRDLEDGIRPVTVADVLKAMK
jgi:hypothetical protein